MSTVSKRGIARKMADLREKREQQKKRVQNARVYAPTHQSRPKAPVDRPEDIGRSKQKKQPVDHEKTRHQVKSKPGRERREKRQEEHVSIHRMENMSRQHLKQAALEQMGKGKVQKEEPELKIPETVVQQEPQNIPRRAELRKKQKKKRKRTLSRNAIIAWCIIGVMLLGLFAAGWFFLLLEEVDITGIEQYPQESILYLSGLQTGDHMLLCDLEKARQNIESNAYLEVVSIERQWPNTVCIEIHERKEVAAIRTLDVDVIIDAKGHVLSIGSSSDLSGLIQVMGVSVTGYQVNHSIAASTDFQVQALLSLLHALQEMDMIHEVAFADISNPLRSWLMTRDGIQVVLGQPDELTDKLTWMQDALPSLRASGVTSGTLDVSAHGGAIWSPDKKNQAQPEQEVPEDGAEPALEEEPVTEEP